MLPACCPLPFSITLKPNTCTGPGPERKQNPHMDIRKLQKIVVNALEAVKAHDIQTYDVRHITPMFDRVIIASTDSVRQARAIVNHLREDIREGGARIHSVEGEDSGEWVLVDLGDIVVHIMQTATREHYKLEELWDQPKPRAPRKAAKTTAKAAAGRKD